MRLHSAEVAFFSHSLGSPGFNSQHSLNFILEFLGAIDGPINWTEGEQWQDNVNQTRVVLKFMKKSVMGVKVC